MRAQYRAEWAASNSQSTFSSYPVACSAFWRAVVADAELAKHSSFVLRALANVLHWRTVALPIMCVGKEKSCRGKVDDVLHFVRCERGTRVHVRHAIVDELSALLTREKWQFASTMDVVEEGEEGELFGHVPRWRMMQEDGGAAGWDLCQFLGDLGFAGGGGRAGAGGGGGGGRGEERRRNENDAKRSGGEEQKRRDGSDAGTVLMMLGGFDPGGVTTMMRRWHVPVEQRQRLMVEVRRILVRRWAAAWANTAAAAAAAGATSSRGV